MTIPILIAMIILALRENRWQWDGQAQVLLCLGFAMVMLLVWRQWVVQFQNRRLYASLQRTSSQLEEKVEDLADLSRRLEILNRRAHHLNSLQALPEVAEAALELACSFERSPGGWITVNGNDQESVVAVRGSVNQSLVDDPELRSANSKQSAIRAVSLEIRGETLGTIFLTTPDGTSEGPDLLPVIAAHVATAIDNSRRYEEAVHLAERDALTGLFNHRGIHKRLAGESLRAQRSGSELSLIMVDLDDFKLLNDTYGHPVGDAVLRQISEAITKVLRHADLAGRVGGDELLLVLPNTGAEGALQLAERLQETVIAHPYVTPDCSTVTVGLSLGIATYPHDAQSMGQLIEVADANLYASKQRGGNTITGGPTEEEDDGDANGIIGVIGRLLNVVGARDHYTRRHSEDVVSYALSLGEAMGLSEGDLSTLRVAAILHDVGKIGVPVHLLRKPSALSAGEEDVVRRHVDMSAAVIRDMPRLAEVAKAVHAHHEHHDGNGYPTESSGDSIPLLGRILAIADAYSAMTLDKPYRKTLTPTQARVELEKAAGTQFDPELVRRFVEVLDVQEARIASA